MYTKGDGGMQDKEKAEELWQKAAQQGLIQAQHNLGIMYANGDGVTQNYEKAVELWQKAADQGFAESQYNLV